MNKRYILKCICLATAVVALDYAAGQALRHFYFTQSQGRLYNITTAIETQTAQILIIGSSRAMHHYDPGVISHRLGLSCFNAGNDAQGMPYYAALLEAIATRHSPQVVVLDVNIYALSRDDSSYDMLYQLNPYAARHPEIWSILSLRSHERIKHLSQIYPFNSMAARIIMGNLSIRTRDASNNGFTVMDGEWDEPLRDTFFPSDEALDPIKSEMFTRLISICKAKGILLIASVSPTFRNIRNEPASIICIRRICERENIPMISYLNDPAFAVGHLYHDPSHLNGVGAREFSDVFSQWLIRELQIGNRRQKNGD
ncbi:MAG: hypothetical protein LBC81_01405 [Tannerellaceae bacterium]|jgi:hypothetical protein|nr:hypothetical protein [Tannerellaceae bacterium]